MSTINLTAAPEVLENLGALKNTIFGPTMQMFQSAGTVFKNTTQVDPTVIEVTECFKVFETNYNEVVEGYERVYNELSNVDEVRELLSKQSLGVDVRNADIQEVKAVTDPSQIKGL